MIKNKGFIGLGLIIAIVLGVAIVGGGVYYLGTKKNTKIIENPSVANPIEENNSHEVPAGPYGDETNYVAPKPINSPTTTVATTNLKTYTNSEYGFSFNYPSSWKQPVLSQQSTRNTIDFSNGFSVITGFNYDQTKGGNSTITEITNSYANDNNFQNVKTQNLKIDEHLATKITYYGVIDKKNYTDLYIYQDQQIQEKYIELVADDSVNGKVFDQIASSFKFIK